MKEYKFYQNKNCPFFPQEDNGNACHPESDPETHNCLFCFCPLYYLPLEKCPEKANSIILEDGTKDCSKCLFPHRPENYDKIIETLKDNPTLPGVYRFSTRGIMCEESKNNDLRVTLEDLWARARMDIEAMLLEVRVMKEYDILGDWDENEQDQ